MKLLILIRHGKSNWDAPSSDKHRTLAARGYRDAAMMSSVLTAALPDGFTVWCSSAARTAATMQVFAENVPFRKPDIVLKDELYTFDVHMLANAISGCAEDISCLVIFGHNEAITDFVNKYGDRAIGNVPTCGVVSISFDTSWKALRHGTTRMVVFPNDIR